MFHLFPFSNWVFYVLGRNLCCCNSLIVQTIAVFIPVGEYMLMSQWYDLASFSAYDDAQYHGAAYSECAEAKNDAILGLQTGGYSAQWYVVKLINEGHLPLFLGDHRRG